MHFANSLNRFFNRFDTQDYTASCEGAGRTPAPTLHSGGCTATAGQVQNWQGPGAGMDSYRTAKVPDLWKTSTVAPIPPKPRQSEPNHFRPVALTPIITKCMEKIMLHLILSTVGPQLDPHQFAHRPKRGTEDAVACLLHSLLHHLQTPNNFASVLCVDTTSAFNTIQRHQVIETLKHLDIIPLHLH